MKKLIILLALLLPAVSFAQLDFTVNYVKHIKGYPVFEVRVPSHFIKMNETRTTNGANPLIETKELKDLALERGIFAFEHFDYFNDNPGDPSISHHEGSKYPENYGSQYEGAGTSNSNLKDVDVDFVKARMDISHSYYKNTGFVSMLINKGERYNNSPGHFSNRINQKHTTYGDCFLVTFIPVSNPDYNPKGEGIQRKTIPKMVVIHYELFQ